MANHKKNDNAEFIEPVANNKTNRPRRGAFPSTDTTCFVTYDATKHPRDIAANYFEDIERAVAALRVAYDSDDYDEAIEALTTQRINKRINMNGREISIQVNVKLFNDDSPAPTDTGLHTTVRLTDVTRSIQDAVSEVLSINPLMASFADADGDQVASILEMIASEWRGTIGVQHGKVNNQYEVSTSIMSRSRVYDKIISIRTSLRVTVGANVIG